MEHAKGGGGGGGGGGLGYSAGLPFLHTYHGVRLALYSCARNAIQCHCPPPHHYLTPTAMRASPVHCICGHCILSLIARKSLHTPAHSHKKHHHCVLAVLGSLVCFGSGVVTIEFLIFVLKENVCMHACMQGGGGGGVTNGWDVLQIFTRVAKTLRECMHTLTHTHASKEETPCHEKIKTMVPFVFLSLPCSDFDRCLCVFWFFSFHFISILSKTCFFLLHFLLKQP